MKALILAAGYGTRLYPLTKEFPKSLLRVGNRPMIDHIIDKVSEIKEINEIIIVINDKFSTIFQNWKSGRKAQKRISLVDDQSKGLDDRLGAIGDMNFAVKKKKIKEDLLVIGGDNLFKDNLYGFIYFARVKKSNPVIGVYDIKGKNLASNYGVVKMDKNNLIKDFQEKPRNPKSTFVAMCLYYFPKEKLKLIKQYTAAKNHKMDAVGFYINWLIKEVPTYGYKFEGYWCDIGDRHFYHQVQRKFLDKKGRSYSNA